MKTTFLASALLSLSLTASLPAQSERSNPAESGASPTPNSPASATDALANTGVVLKDGTPWLIQNNQARRLNATELPEGQMLNGSGRLVPLPSDITGFDATSGSPSASTSTSASSSTADPSTIGITMRNGTVFLVRDGKATRIDTAALGANLMLTLDGRNVPIPAGVAFEDKPQDSSTSAGSITPGTVTPGKVTPGRVEGGNVRGGDVRGGDVRGGDTTGGSTSR
ncbi:MAG TPA: hypothetical protein VD994_11340 [Prosthecobacter sp.]|nr:hypothetical protein [Prosthecobacter sp.]